MPNSASNDSQLEFAVSKKIKKRKRPEKEKETTKKKKKAIEPPKVTEPDTDVQLVDKSEHAIDENPSQVQIRNQV